MRFLSICSLSLFLGLAAHAASAVAPPPTDKDHEESSEPLLRGRRKELGVGSNVKPRPATAAVKSLSRRLEQLSMTNDKTTHLWATAIGSGDDDATHEAIMMSITRSLMNIHKTIFVGDQDETLSGAPDEDDLMTKMLLASLVDEKKSKEVMSAITQGLVDIQKSIPVEATVGEDTKRSDTSSRRLVEATERLFAPGGVPAPLSVENKEIMSSIENLRKAAKVYVVNKDKTALSLELRSTIATLQSALDDRVMRTAAGSKRRHLASSARNDEMTVTGKTVLNEIITNLSMAIKDNAATMDVGTVAVIQDLAALLSKFPEYGVLFEGDQEELIDILVVIIVLIGIITLPIWLPILIIGLVLFYIIGSILTIPIILLFMLGFYLVTCFGTDEDGIPNGEDIKWCINYEKPSREDEPWNSQ